MVVRVTVLVEFDICLLFGFLSCEVINLVFTDLTYLCTLLCCLVFDFDIFFVQHNLF